MPIEWEKVLSTQKGIIEFAEEAAKILAEAGLASSKAVGDSPEYAIRRWSKVIEGRALEILRQKKNKKSLPAPKPLEIENEEKSDGD